MREWVFEGLLLIAIAALAYFVVVDVRNVAERRQHQWQMQKTTEYYSDLFKQHKSKTNTPESPDQQPGN